MNIRYLFLDVLIAMCAIALVITTYGAYQQYKRDQQIPCSYPDPQFSGATPADYRETDCRYEK